jgi:CheY-like chemotaxis protein
MKKKILVIDNSPIFLEILNHALTGEFHVKTVTTVEEAIALLNARNHGTGCATGRFDLVITDPDMPGLGDYNVAQLVRGKSRENSFTPVIMLTEKPITDAHLKRDCCAAYIQKSNLDKVRSMARILSKK